MNSKRNSARSGADEPVQVFRQFAWHLAGTLATPKGGATANSPKAVRTGKR